LYASDYGWTSEAQKTNKSVFAAAGAQGTEQPCFNCGGLGHDFSSCIKPKNEDRIKQNRQKYFDARTLARKTQGADAVTTQFLGLEKPMDSQQSASP
jgi:hypothetical protein